MAFNIHFISGLPRSGSTLLAAILRQNPRFHAAISSPLAEIYCSALRSMSGANEFSSTITDKQRLAVLRAICEAFYSDSSPGRLIFDTNRMWCAFLPGIVQLFPATRILCCVRNPAWIIDSVERQIQLHAVRPSRIFNHDAVGNVYSRVDNLTRGTLLGSSLNNLRQAWFGEYADHLLAIRYDSLAERPAETVARIYEVLNEVPFTHNYDDVNFDQPEFDDYIGLPGFHRVQGPVAARPRKTILPPDIFGQHDRCFWEMPGQNPRGVTIL